MDIQPGNCGSGSAQPRWYMRRRYGEEFAKGLIEGSPEEDGSGYSSNICMDNYVISVMGGFEIK